MSASDHTAASMPPTPPPLPPRRPRGSAFPAIALGCGAILLVSLLIVGAIAGAFYLGGRSIRPATDRFFALMESGDFAAVYAESHAALKETMTEQQFVDFAEHLRSALGAMREHSLRGVEFHRDASGSRATASYHVEFERGAADVHLVFIGEGDEWKLAGVNYESEALREALTCPACGSRLEGFSNFCPSCGEALDKDAQVTV